jgi:hypothetical protein
MWGVMKIEKKSKKKPSTRKDLGKVHCEVDNWMELAEDRVQ